jgi:outer membrane protein OmpA-like peptidoglycan-associated protein
MTTMRSRIPILVLFTAAQFGLFLVPSQTYAQKTFSISGTVKDKSTRPVPKINVTLRKGLVNFASGETDPHGNYRVAYAGTERFDVLFNGNTEWYPEVMRNLVGTANNNINVLLVRCNEPTSVAEARRVLDALNYMNQLPEYSAENSAYAKLINPLTFPSKFQMRIFQENVSTRLQDAESMAKVVAEQGQQTERISGQIDELMAVSNAAKGGSKAAQDTADAALAGLNALRTRLALLDEYSFNQKSLVDFKRGEYSMTDASLHSLKRLAEDILKLKGYRIEIKGWVGDEKNTEKAIELSQRRAEAVARYLTGELEIPLWRISAPIGYGSRSILRLKPPNEMIDEGAVEVSVFTNQGINSRDFLSPVTSDKDPTAFRK